MSNTTRYDSLLVRQLAAELHTVLAGQRVESLCFERAFRAVTLNLEQGALRWTLPAGPSYLPGVQPDCAGQPLTLPRKARLNAVTALSDERILRFEFGGGKRNNATAALVIELLPPQPNVIALDDAERVLKVLAPGGPRPHTRGQPYALPAARNRSGVTAPLTVAEWQAMLGDVPPAEREQRLISSVAFMSPVNAAAVLGSAATDASQGVLRDAHGRYLDVVSGPTRAALLESAKGVQPYGHPLWRPAASAKSLLAAFEQAGAQQQASDPVARLEQSVERARRKVARLEQELAGGGDEAARLRSAADLLMANLKGLKRGQAQIQVNDFDGAPRLLQLDPALSPAANAEAWYAQARKRERAVQQLPALIEKARQETAELQRRLERVRAGGTPDLPATTAAPRNQPERKLPYHRFRTSGGLEVRVGRNSKANDELTLHHCAPDDVWLHARAVGGAHVVLRWSDPANNPPKLDLEQAAALAALHSKARHAGVVPIDWTRRKYVRKPRKAPPGSVLVERVKTVFVSPKESLVDALRWLE